MVELLRVRINLELMPKRWVTILLLVASLPAEAALAKIRFRPVKGRAQSLNVRRRLNTRPLVDATRSYWVDWTQAASTDGSWASPLTVGFQPSGKLEFSLNMDAFDRYDAGDHHVTNATDHVTLAASRSLVNGRIFDLAVMPQVTSLTRNGSGVRAGGSVLARWDVKGNSFGTSATWTGATTPNPDNPAGLWDLGAGYGHKFGRWLVHGNLTWERATGAASFYVVLEGAQRRISPHWSVDLGGQHHGLHSGLVEHQVLATLSWSSSTNR